MQTLSRVAVVIALSLWFTPAAGAQTTIVQRSDGTTTVTVQTDASGNTVVMTQGAGGAGPDGAIQGGTTFDGAGGTRQVIIGGASGGVLGSQFGGADGPPPVGVPPRDQMAAPATGTSRIRGRVVAADTGRPLRRALVRLSSPAVRESRTTNTDQNGQYEFADLPAATYTIVASRSGYVQMGYKQTRPGVVPPPLSVSERELKERVDIALPPGGVITGQVVDEYGEPVSDVMVSAQRTQFINGARRPMPVGAPSSSNDIGEFRIYGLAPGEYYVLAAPRGQLSPFDTVADRTGYSLTFYPSSGDLASAQRVRIRGGDVVSNIVIALTQTRLARVSGTVVDATGKPATGGTIVVTPRAGIGPPSATGFIRLDGSFTIGSLAPADYILRAISGSGPGGAVSGTSMSTASISVSGADLSNVVLQPQAPVAIAGRFTGDAASLARIQPAATRIMVVPFGGAMVMSGPLPPARPVRDDLSFELSAYPGTVVVRPITLSGVVVRSVRLNGRDVTKGFEIEAGAPITDLDVEVTSSTARLSVSTMNARDEGVADRDIIVFPQDQSQWDSQMPGHGSVGRTDAQGRYQTPQLLAGPYYVATTDPPEPGQGNDPEYLESLRARAQRITLGEGETATLSFRVTDR